MMIKLKETRLRSSGNAKGQIVQIPINVIREWGLKPGDTINIFKGEDGSIIIKPSENKNIYV